MLRTGPTFRRPSSGAPPSALFDFGELTLFVFACGAAWLTLEKAGSAIEHSNKGAASDHGCRVLRTGALAASGTRLIRGGNGTDSPSRWRLYAVGDSQASTEPRVAAIGQREVNGYPLARQLSGEELICCAQFEVVAHKVVALELWKMHTNEFKQMNLSQDCGCARDF